MDFDRCMNCKQTFYCIMQNCNHMHIYPWLFNMFSIHLIKYQCSRMDMSSLFIHRFFQTCWTHKLEQFHITISFIFWKVMLATWASRLMNPINMFYTSLLTFPINIHKRILFEMQLKLVHCPCFGVIQWFAYLFQS